MCFNTGLGIQKKRTPQPSDAVLTCRRGVCSLHQFLGFSSAMEDAASLEDATSSSFLGLDQKRSLETSLFLNGSFTTKEDVNRASITESRDAGMVMNADSVIYARLNRSENGRADSITIEERSTEKSCKRKDRRWTLGWDSSTVTRDSGARFESS